MLDRKLLLYAEWATNIINTYLGRAYDGIDYKTRTQYMDGTGTQKLLLRNRPVYPSPPSPYTALKVVIDDDGFYGTGTGSFTTNSTAKTLVYGTDYTLRIDQDDGSSRSGVLVRLHEYWFKPQVRQAGLLAPFMGPDTGSIKVTYTAGYTLDTLPAAFRMAANLIIAQLRFLFPSGLWTMGESYEERSVSYGMHKLMDMVENLLYPYRTWVW